MLVGSLRVGDEDRPVVHTFTDLSESWNIKSHVGSRLELIDVEQCAYVNYLTVFKPDNLVYAGYHKRGSKGDGYGWYSGSVGERNHLWHLRKDHPADDFLLIVYAGHDNSDDALTLEDSTIGYLWESVGKFNDGGKCLNLARYHSEFRFDWTGVKHSRETRERMSGENNSMFGRRGADHPGSRPVMELISGKVYNSQRDACRDLGLRRSVVSHQASRNVRRIREGQSARASSNVTCRGKPNRNHGKAWLDYEFFVSELNSGRSVEVTQ